MQGIGGRDVGAVSDNRYEKDDNLKIAKLIQKYLQEKDIKVVMTRENNSTVELRDRCKKANKKKVDLFVSLHRNGIESSDSNGIEVWVNSDKKENNVKLAENILKQLDKTEIQNNRGIKYGTIKGEDTNYYVLDNTNMTSCLIELGFITNEKDNQLFDKNIDEYAKKIAEGIIATLNEKQR